ncbi:OadG family protein [Inmirania thermothiophila]|uniref:Oxaloacetate decarboxylase gamma chain n=1 Tax=Inmirania thermothiophila TaxID=1750597 RepID=A0A3N1Y291_9GAMM|nr:OadG family protein [Inmirania thermothiophila]ROR32638.1 oxaloacetate decarboxylase gamma subunit [Inmirania thermothiophila]
MTLAVLRDGLALTVAGMGTVFAFLALLVGAVKAMSRLALRLAPPAPAAADDPREEARRLAAAAAAVRAHRARRR